MAQMGRKTKYKPIYVKKIIEYFDSFPIQIKLVKKESKKTLRTGAVDEYKEFEYIAGDMPTLFKFSRKIGVHEDTLLEWSKVKTKTGKLKYPDFSGAYNMAKKIQKEWLISVGLKGLAPPASYIFTAKNITDMTDKQEIDHTSKGERITGFNYQPPVSDETNNTND